MPEISEDTIKEMYHIMRLARTLDEKLFNLQRSGKIGTYAQIKGQEASEIGSAFALEKDDWVVPSFRELGVMLARGADRSKLVQAWNGDLRAFEDPVHSRNLPVAIPIASQCLHATGIAWAEKLKKTNSAVIVYFGDGATSEGDFHEALNFASELELPVVFFCQNNQWAISTPRANQTHGKTIAQKAIAYGMTGIQIDGNDVLGVYKATQDALALARQGKPVLIESITFRMGDHTTSDDSSKYRTPEMIEEWTAKDPLLRLEKYFQKKGLWTEEYNTYVTDEVAKEIEKAVEEGLAKGLPPVENMFEHIFAEMPIHLQKQLVQVKEEIAQKEAKANGGSQ
jgi:pyruvate dehydrogenase E1 component alpha subunit